MIGIKRISCCDKCELKGIGEAYADVDKDAKVVLIIDPIKDTHYAHKMLCTAMQRLPPTYRRVGVSVVPIVKCVSSNVHLSAYRQCRWAVSHKRIRGWAKSGKIVALCGKSVQKIILGHAVNQRSSSGYIVQHDLGSLALLPGLQDMYDLEAEDVDDYLDLFVEGLTKIISSLV